MCYNASVMIQQWYNYATCTVKTLTGMVTAIFHCTMK